MKEEILAQTEWLSIRRKDGYEYVAEEKATEGVSILLYDARNKTIMCRNELIPPHNSIKKRTSISGKVQKGEGRRVAAIKTVADESGFIISENDLLPLNCIYPYKSSSYRIWLFGCNILGKQNSLYRNNGTGNPIYISVLDALQVSDPLISTAIVRLHYFHGVSLLDRLIPLGKDS